MTWLQTSVIKKVKTISLYALLNINLFLQQNFLTQTCYIMVPDCRYFDKDSKEYLFAILGFFYEFLLILQIHCKNLKTNLILCLGPWILQKGAQKE